MSDRALLTALAVIAAAQLVMTTVTAVAVLSIAASSQRTADAVHDVACSVDRAWC